jgi:hypothetical protein
VDAHASTFVVPLTRCVSIVALLVLSCASRAAADVCVEADVRFAEPTTASPLLLGSMTDEAKAIWNPYGVQIQWTGAVETASCPSIAWSFEVQVSDGRPPRSTAQPVTLGSTWVGRLPISRRSPIHLDYAAIRRLVGSLNTFQLDHTIGRRETSASDMGRALGRVLAHEIGHALLGATHQRRGLMRTTIVATELVGHRRWGYTLSDVEIARLRERERELSARPAAGSVLSAVPWSCDD